MYLIFLGMTVLLIQLPLDWSAGYVLKAIGFAICAAGTRELGGIALWKNVRGIMEEKSADFQTQRERALSLLERNAAVGTAVSALSAGLAALFEFVIRGRGTAGNITACVLGMAVTALALSMVFGVTARIYCA